MVDDNTRTCDNTETAAIFSDLLATMYYYYYILLLLGWVYTSLRYSHELEGHSVERMYLRQRSSDASVNKTILKPRLAVAARRQWDFPDVEFRVAALIRYRRKQSGSGIRL